MKRINILSWMLLLLTAVTLTACDDDDDDYKKAEVSGAQVYFSTDLPAEQDVTKEATQKTINVSRVNTDGDLTVELEVTAESSNFTIPSTVSFSDGSANAPLTITYDPDAIDYGQFETITVKIKESDVTTPWGNSSYTFSIGIPEPWTEWEPFGAGTCTWSYSQYFNGDDTGLAISYRENKVNVSQAQFMIENALYGVSVTIDYDKSTGTLKIPETFTGYVNSTYGNIYLSDLDTYAGNGAVGTFDAEQGILDLYVIYYCTEGYFKYGHEYVYVDGYDRKDVTTEISYAGKFLDSKDNPSIVANVTLGADVESGKVALVPGELTQETFDQILAGTYQPLYDVTQSGEVKIDASDLEDGDYTLVLVSYIGSEAQDYATASFSYSASSAKETWTDIQTGTYTYSVFFGSADDPQEDTGLVLSQSNDNPKRFKISHWGYDVDFIFTMEDDGSIMVADQETGYVHSQYGMVMVDDLVDYTVGTQYGQSSYDAATGTFNFALAYYIPGENGGVLSYGTETFRITANAKSMGKTKSMAERISSPRMTLGKILLPRLHTSPVVNPVVIRK